MCTLSWKPQDSGYLLLFNRDESRLRSAASPPLVHQHKKVKFLAPTDTQHGGTWLLVNEYGISIALLNNYAASEAIANMDDSVRSSRGLLPLACADYADVAAVMEHLQSMHLGNYPPFHLVAMGVDEAMVFTWNGQGYQLTKLNPFGGMLTSSAYNSTGIAVSRSELFLAMVGEMASAKADHLENFHWYRSDDGATGIRMLREDACTHSISRITVSFPDQMIRYQYSPQKEIHPDEENRVYHLNLLSQASSR
ncbi:MAG: NRDE family protein [Proteobacteria bacterium]|nr:NRDE family protein [Pseudomonadota bacterium]